MSSSLIFVGMQIEFALRNILLMQFYYHSASGIMSWEIYGIMSTDDIRKVRGSSNNAIMASLVSIERASTLSFVSIFHLKYRNVI